jgi:MFS family permease
MTATIVLGFLVFGTYHSFWAASLSELKRTVGMTDGQLGVLATVGAICAIPLQFSSGALLHRFGGRLFPFVCVLIASNLVVLGFVNTRPPLFGIFVVSAIGFGLFNICINTSALHEEHKTSKRRLSTLHALFSAGGIVGSLIVGALLAAHWRLQFIYLVAATLMAGSAIFLRRMTTELKGDPEAERPLIFDREVVKSRAIRSFVPFSMAAVMGEGILYTWPVIYLRDELGAGALVGASGLLAFYSAMCIGRFGLAYLQRHFGRLEILQLSGFFIAAGMTLSLATGSLVLCIAGLLIAGLGYSACYPNMLSVAGSLVPGRAAGVSSFVVPLGAIAALCGPVLVGVISDATSLRLALCIEIFIGLFVLTGITVFRRTSMAGDLRNEHRAAPVV